MLKDFSLPLVLIVIIFFISGAQADYSEQDTIYYDWGQYDYANSRMFLVECLCRHSPAKVRGGGKSVGNPTFTANKTVKSQTNRTWTVYILMLDPLASAAFGMGTASSTVFKTIKYTDSKTIEFYEPNTVEAGKPVTLQFDIQIPTGLFTFGLMQQLIPKPTTVGLLYPGSPVLIEVKQ